MTLPSFSLQSTLALLDSCWGAQALLYFCMSLVVLGFMPWWESLGKIQVKENRIGSYVREKFPQQILGAISNCTKLVGGWFGVLVLSL